MASFVKSHEFSSFSLCMLAYAFLVFCSQASAHYQDNEVSWRGGQGPKNKHADDDARKNIPPGELGSHCKKNDFCTSLNPKAVCFAKYCNCVSGYVACIFTMNGANQTACFGIEDTPCRSAAEFIQIESFLKDQSQFNTKLQSLHDQHDGVTKPDPALNPELIADFIDRLETIEKAGMIGKQEEDWSCYSGKCINGKCGSGMNKLLLPMEISIGSRAQAQTRLPFSASTFMMTIVVALSSAFVLFNHFDIP